MNRRPSWQDPTIDFKQRVREICRQFVEEFPHHSDQITPLIDRMSEPMRVAIAGRVKTGKSTLLNALVGERLAPTDAGECTKIITSYEHDLRRTVTATLSNGEKRPLPFSTDKRRLDVDLLGFDPTEVEGIRVGWPSQRLEQMTLIDTPGLEAIDQEAEARTHALFAGHDSEDSHVDAVIYLMRHIHSSDTRFLEAFVDSSVPYTSPVNSIVVLSRADELGAGSLDSMSTAERIAGRYSEDERVKALAATVLPVAGLLAETASTWTETENSVLARLAHSDPDVLGDLLLSVDRLASQSVVPHGGELVKRLGIFGLRLLIRDFNEREALSATETSTSLRKVSGIKRLEAILTDVFTNRASLLQGRSCIAQLKGFASELQAADEEPAAWLSRAVEEAESAAVELELLRAVNMVAAGATSFDTASSREVTRLLRDATIDGELGLEGSLADKRIELQRRVERWRREAVNPALSHESTSVASAVARAYESALWNLEHQ